MKKLLLVLICAFPLMIASSYAQRMVYTPKNPAFGGNTFNYQWMLSSAQSQDTFRDPNLRDRDDFGRSPLDDFSESLNRQILSRLSRELVTRQFGEDQIAEGNYQLGDYQIEIGNVGNGLSITIIDTRTGATTIVEVPFF